MPVREPFGTKSMLVHIDPTQLAPRGADMLLEMTDGDIPTTVHLPQAIHALLPDHPCCAMLDCEALLEVSVSDECRVEMREICVVRRMDTFLVEEDEGRQLGLNLA